MSSNLKWSFIDRWFSNPNLIRTFASNIEKTLTEKFPDPEKRKNVVILFSAHSVPQYVSDKNKILRDLLMKSYLSSGDEQGRSVPRRGRRVGSAGHGTIELESRIQTCLAVESRTSPMARTWHRGYN